MNVNVYSRRRILTVKVVGYFRMVGYPSRIRSLTFAWFPPRNPHGWISWNHGPSWYKCCNGRMSLLNIAPIVNGPFGPSRPPRRRTIRWYGRSWSSWPRPSGIIPTMRVLNVDSWRSWKSYWVTTIHDGNPPTRSLRYGNDCCNGSLPMSHPVASVAWPIESWSPSRGYRPVRGYSPPVPLMMIPCPIPLLKRHKFGRTFPKLPRIIIIIIIIRVMIQPPPPPLPWRIEIVSCHYHDTIRWINCSIDWRMKRMFVWPLPPAEKARGKPPWRHSSRHTPPLFASLRYYGWTFRTRNSPLIRIFCTSKMSATNWKSPNHPSGPWVCNDLKNRRSDNCGNWNPWKLPKRSWPNCSNRTGRTYYWYWMMSWMLPRFSGFVSPVNNPSLSRRNHVPISMAWIGPWISYPCVHRNPWICFVTRPLCHPIIFWVGLWNCVPLSNYVSVIRWRSGPWPGGFFSNKSPRVRSRHWRRSWWKSKR